MWAIIAFSVADSLVVQVSLAVQASFKLIK